MAHYRSVDCPREGERTPPRTTDVFPTAGFSSLFVKIAGGGTATLTLGHYAIFVARTTFAVASLSRVLATYHRTLPCRTYTFADKCRLAADHESRLKPMVAEARRRHQLHVDRFAMPRRAGFRSAGKRSSVTRRENNGFFFNDFTKRWTNNVPFTFNRYCHSRFVNKISTPLEENSFVSYLIK